MPQPDHRPRLITDGSTFEERHPEAPDLTYPETLEVVPGDTPQTDEEIGVEIDSAVAEGRPAQIFGFVPDDQPLNQADASIEVTGSDEEPATAADTEKTADADLLAARQEADKAAAAAADERLRRQQAELTEATQRRKVIVLQDRLLAREAKLAQVTIGDGLPRSPLLDNPDLDTTDPSAFRGSIIAIATLVLALLAAYGFGIRDDAREPLLALLGTAATIYATYSIRKRAYSPVTTAKLVDTAYKAGLQGEDRPKVA